jgi:phospholipid/cholesterol/gamma-HCH transport system substrate-binding protein
MRKKDHANLLKVGIFITSLTVVLMIMIISIGKENSFFSEKVDIRARVSTASNVRPGSYVELKGIRVGTVKKIDIISEEMVEITLTILEEQLKWIKQDSLVSISNAGLVGDKFVEIYRGSKEAPVFDPKKDVLLSENLVDLKQIMTKGESIASLSERILTRIDHILAQMEEGNKINGTINSLNKASSNLEKITEDLRQADMGKMVKNINSSMAKLDKASHSIEGIMTRIEKGPGTMNALIYDDGLHDDLRALLGGAQRNKVIKYFIRESIKNSERKKSKTSK